MKLWVQSQNDLWISSQKSEQTAWKGKRWKKKSAMAAMTTVCLDVMIVMILGPSMTAVWYSPFWHRLTLWFVAAIARKCWRCFQFKLLHPDAQWLSVQRRRDTQRYPEACRCMAHDCIWRSCFFACCTCEHMNYRIYHISIPGAVESSVFGQRSRFLGWAVEPKNPKITKKMTFLILHQESLQTPYSQPHTSPCFLSNSPVVGDFTIAAAALCRLGAQVLGSSSETSLESCNACRSDEIFGTAQWKWIFWATHLNSRCFSCPSNDENHETDINWWIFGLYTNKRRGQLGM